MPGMLVESSSLNRMWALDVGATQVPSVAMVCGVRVARVAIELDLAAVIEAVFQASPVTPTFMCRMTLVAPRRRVCIGFSRGLDT